MLRLFILRNRIAVPCESMSEWGSFMSDETACRVAETYVGEARVSTVFLGVDHNHLGHGDPLLFETMTFTPEGQGRLRGRYFTWADAANGHQGEVDALQRELDQAAELVTLTLESLRPG